MRICIFGAGAVGGHFAARLGAAGHDVSVVARGAHLAAIREQGVTLLSGEERIQARVRASDDPAELGAHEFVIVTLKATGLDAVPHAIAPLMGREGVVVFCQNGIPWWYAQGLSAARPKPPELSRLDPHGRLARAIAPERLLGGVVYSANEVIEPGVVENRTPGRNMLTVGEPDDRRSARVAALRAALEDAGLHSPETGDIRQVLWNKLANNLVSSTLCVIVEETVAAMLADPALQALAARIREEGRAIAAAHGVAIEGAPARPGAPPAGGLAHKPSMLQDYERGRPMEIEAQVMAPLAFARSANVAAPVFELAAALAAHKAAAKGLYQP
ncbi:MAG TPA: 2-dehydropantoate 2-reductase [Burkholderiales bacterium]|nr:2-dehydropantoate 2-reductase [Burkholderiales bacterium]